MRGEGGEGCVSLRGWNRSSGVWGGGMGHTVGGGGDSGGGGLGENR